MQCGKSNYSNVLLQIIFPLYICFYFHVLSFVVTKLKAMLLKDFGILFTEDQFLNEPKWNIIIQQRTANNTPTHIIIYLLTLLISTKYTSHIHPSFCAGRLHPKSKNKKILFTEIIILVFSS